MSLHFMIGLIGLLYIVLFGGLALMRREGLSLRFAMEAVILTALAMILVVLTPIQIHPVLFLLVLYLITLRARILVDLASFFARRGRYALAERLFNIAERLWPDPPGDLIIKVNRATMLLIENKLDEAIALFKEVLNPDKHAYLGVKYEAAAHFNLGVAYLRNESHSMATIEFNSTIDTWPASLYAQSAQQALDRQRHKEGGAAEDTPANQ